MKDNIKVVTILAIGLVVAVSIYSNGVTSRQEARFTQAALSAEAEATKESTRQRKLNSCLSTADSDRWDDWKLNCNSDFEYYDDSDEIKSCSVPTYLAEDIDSRRQDEKENCLEMYK